MNARTAALAGHVSGLLERTVAAKLRSSGGLIVSTTEPSIRIAVTKSEFAAVLGNLRSDDITINGVSIANTPWSPLNPVVS